MESIRDYIPHGKENAITRKYLVKICLNVGLIDTAVTDPDRAMRKLISEARLVEPILSSDSGGYYKPTEKEYIELRKYIKREEARAKSVFRGLKQARALYKTMGSEATGV